MLASKAVKRIEGVTEAVAAMGTETNIGLLKGIGFDPLEFKGVRPNDLILAVDAMSEETIAETMKAVDEFLSRRSDPGGEVQAYRPVNLGNAIRFAPQSNLVLISVPGAYAAREARLALNHGLHVMIFSDNVAIEDEIELKQIARERGLLMMGPDCGTAIINGTPLCFANRVRRGDIGVVAASGSGLQEVTCCVHKLGAGISQALGTGGRDLKDPRVGGMMMKMGIQALSDDDATKVIVVISKPPAPELAQEIISKLEKTGKAGVVCFLGQPNRPAQGNLQFAENLTQTARLAVELSGGDSGGQDDTFTIAPEQIQGMAEDELRQMNPGQKYLRGLYVGGTLADESIFGIQRRGFEIYSNIQPNKVFLLPDAHQSRKHTIVDLGDDAFTVGRPHPMIDPSIRQERLEAEMTDPEVALVLMDFVLGDGAHENPAGHMMDTLVRARQLDKKMGRHLSIVVSITGTDDDIQDIEEQKKLLASQHCIVMPSNYQAGRLAATILNGLS